MDWNKLKAFYEVAINKSISKASIFRKNYLSLENEIPTQRSAFLYVLIYLSANNQF